MEAPSEAIVQIDKDVPRTFGELDDASAAGCRRALRAALLAFVVHEPDLGYCQVLIPPPLIVVHPLGRGRTSCWGGSCSSSRCLCPLAL